MRRLILTTGLFGVIVLLLTACEKDEQATFDKPLVIAPEKISVPLNATDLSAIFRVSVDSRLNASYSATGSGVSVTNPSGNIGADSIVIKYNTGSATGSASIILTVTDSENQTASSTYVLNVGQAAQQVKITENITAEKKWSADTIYILGGRITVVDGASLTIEAGTIIKGEAGTGANATALLIAQGGKLFAEGTAEKPVVFTSIADELTPDDIHSGNVASPNLDPDINGLWGGVIILGKAPISASNESGDVSIIQIEGIPTSDQNGLYGGNLPNDNSGIIKYVSIRHGGTNIGSGNEINGLTLGGIGSETVIENIEIVSNQDDGIEWFGGTVNVTNAVV